MSVDAKIRTALSGIVTDIVPNQYNGESPEYIVFYYHEYPAAYGDDQELECRAAVTVRYVLPTGQNPNAKKTSIKAALKGIADTGVDVTNASDEDGQIYIFEFDMLEET